MKTLFIGDIHGKIEVIRYVNENFKQHRKVFIGDYVDDFVRTRAEQAACLDLLFEMIEKGDTIALMGNHDFGYLKPRVCWCSGNTKNFLNHLEWHGYLPKMWKFPFYYYDKENNILATHAGIANYVFREAKLNLDTLEDTFFNWQRDPDYITPLYWIGNTRGGADRVGGPLWCDWNHEYTPVPGLTQIMGHTGYIDVHREMDAGIRQRGTDYNLDCLNRVIEFLEFDDEAKKFTIIQIEKELVL